jgi:GAF domain-containing protein
VAGSERGGDGTRRVDQLEAELDVLRSALIGAEVSAPATHERLLAMIVETAASVISARAGALFLVDEEQGDLVFKAAFGGKAEDVKEFRVPLGHGIAGGVALSGMPLAVSSASNDPRWAKDIGSSVEYTPDSIACVPLFYEDRVIGALELLDKEGTSGFTPADLHTLSLFADQAAVTIEQSLLRQGARALLADEDDPAFRASLELAELVREIAQAGEHERTLCREVLRAVAEYVRSRPA